MLQIPFVFSIFFLFHSSSSSYFQSGYHTGYLEEFTHHFTTGSEWISYCRRLYAARKRCKKDWISSPSPLQLPPC
ncbi:unnamed protein product [Victoria cruziana]